MGLEPTASHLISSVYTNMSDMLTHLCITMTSNHQPRECLLSRFLGRRSKKTSKLRVTAGNSPVTGEFRAQVASNAENVSIWWRHHGLELLICQ